MKCPDFDTLLEALLDPASHPETGAHLAGGCPQCERRKLILEETQGLLRLGDLPRPDVRWMHVAAGLPRRADHVPAPRWNGDAVVEDRPAPALRGASLCHRHLRFAAGPATVDIALLDPATLVGTVSRDPRRPRATPPGGEPLRDEAVCVLDGPGGPRQVALESNGDFRFEGVDPGHYLLLLEGRDWNVVLQDVDLTARSWDEQTGRGPEA